MGLFQVIRGIILNIKIQQIFLLGVIGIIIIFVAITTLIGHSNTYGLNADQVKAQAIQLTSVDFQKNAINMKGKPIMIQGKIVHINQHDFLLDTGESVWLNEMVYVNVQGDMPPNIVKKDVVTVYAVVNGEITYEVIGGNASFPEVTVYPENIFIDGQ